MPKKKTAGQAKVAKVMREYKAGKLHTGKKDPGKGALIKSRKQAVAVALSEGRKKAKNTKNG